MTLLPPHPLVVPIFPHPNGSAWGARSPSSVPHQFETGIIRNSYDNSPWSAPLHCFKNASKIPLKFREGADAMCIVTQIFDTASLWSRGKLLQSSLQFGMANCTVCTVCINPRNKQGGFMLSVYSVDTLNQRARRFPLT